MRHLKLNNIDRMKKYISIVILVLFYTNAAYSQYTLKNAEDVNWYSNIAQESIFVDFNSNTLLSGEYLYYKVYCKNAKTNRFTKNSKIAYVELIGQNGSVFKHKIRLENGIGQGDFFLPVSIASGNYKIIAYTQWMKNGSGNHFFQSDVVIINPYAKINFSETAEIPVNGTSSSNYNQLKLDVNSAYGTREEVSITVESLNASNAFGEYSISVRKIDELNLGQKQYTSLNYNEMYESSISKKKKVGDVMFLPEIRGEMITGKVTSKMGSKSVAKVEVALSIMSEEAHQDIVLTNEEGVFYFQLTSSYSSSNAMVQVVGENRSDYSIEVFNHQSVDVSNLDIKDFAIHPNFKKLITQKSVYNQIQNAYETVRKNKIVQPKYPEPFYGNYQSVFILENYKRFSDIAETLIEVVDHAWHERRSGQGKKRFANVREREFDPYFGVDLLPMLVVDGALVQDHDEVLYYDAKKVESIAVLRDEFYFGDRVYQGALSIKTNDGDYANTLNSDYMAKFNLFSPQLKTQYYKQNYLEELNSDRVPDFREQLLWKPNFSFQKEKDIVTFFTSDNKGAYVITLEGFTNAGKPISLNKIFEIN